MNRQSAVDITVTVEPTTMQVPDVKTLMEDEAAQKLTEALYVPQTIPMFTNQAPEGTVIAQAPAAGTDWMTGRPVGIAVSAGKDDGTGVLVPEIRGEDVGGRHGSS